MKNWIFGLLIILFSSCSQIRLCKLKPAFSKKLQKEVVIIAKSDDNQYTGTKPPKTKKRIMVRTSALPDSTFGYKQTDLSNGNRDWILEKVLIQNQFQVIDHASFNSNRKETQDSILPFDYIIIIKEDYTQSYGTGISLQSPCHGPSKEFKLYGRTLTFQLIDPYTKLILGYFRANSIPCADGCTILYNKYKVYEINPSAKFDMMHPTNMNNNITGSFEELCQAFIKAIK